MSKFTTTAVAALLMSSSTVAFAQVAERTYYFGADVADPESAEFFVRDRYTAANERYYDGLDPLPVQLGAFEARPVLLLSSQSQSNVFLDDATEVSDTVLVIRPSISTASTWSRHRLGFDALVNHEEFLDLSSESATQYGVSGFGQLDVSSNFAVAGSVSHENFRESRSSIGGTFDSTERTEVERSGVEANALYSRNRLRLRGSLSVDDLDYTNDDLGSFDQNTRDREETTISATAEYAVSRDWSILAGIDHLDRDYNILSTGGLNRDISGVTVRAGTSFELPVSLRGEVSAQFQNFDPADQTLATLEEFGADARVQWFPTTLTTLNVFASQDVTDAGSTGTANAVVTRYGGGVDHELLRTLVLSGAAAFETRDFNPSPREDELTVLSLGATWKLNRNVQVQGGYRYTDQDSDVNPYEDNTFTIAVRFFP